MSIEHLFFIATSPVDLCSCIWVISAKAGDKALSGEWEEIGGYKFKITEDMTMIFKGILCIIKNGEGKLVEELGIEDRQVTRGVFTGYKCYIMRARIKLKKR